jgi:hypothetical protein
LNVFESMHEEWLSRPGLASPLNPCQRCATMKRDKRE